MEWNGRRDRATKEQERNKEGGREFSETKKKRILKLYYITFNFFFLVRTAGEHNSRDQMVFFFFFFTDSFNDPTSNKRNHFLFQKVNRINLRNVKKEAG